MQPSCFERLIPLLVTAEELKECAWMLMDLCNRLKENNLPNCP